jgi:glycosyltransferase involved in cell wall biosynthesis
MPNVCSGNAVGWFRRRANVRMTQTPISDIVIVRNEPERLEGCLAALKWCDELIAIDMESSDESLAVARRYADRVYHVKT